jgi:hypothetical protein
MLQAKAAEKVSKHTLCSTPFPPKIAPFTRQCGQNVEPDKSQIATRRMRIAYWIPKATDTHSEYVMLIDFLLQQWLQGSAFIITL